MSDEVVLIGEGGVLPCTREDLEKMIAWGYVTDNGDGTAEVTETGKCYIATRARFG